MKFNSNEIQFSKSVNTNIEREFLSLIDKHFPPQHKLYTQDFQQKHFKNKL